MKSVVRTVTEPHRARGVLEGTVPTTILHYIEEDKNFGGQLTIIHIPQ